MNPSQAEFYSASLECVCFLWGVWFWATYFWSSQTYNLPLFPVSDCITYSHFCQAQAVSVNCLFFPTAWHFLKKNKTNRKLSMENLQRKNRFDLVKNNMRLSSITPIYNEASPLLQECHEITLRKKKHNFPSFLQIYYFTHLAANWHPEKKHLQKNWKLWCFWCFGFHRVYLFIPKSHLTCELIT